VAGADGVSVLTWVAGVDDVSSVDPLDVEASGTCEDAEEASGVAGVEVELTSAGAFTIFEPLGSTA
jgi:hypothetical protein